MLLGCPFIFSSVLEMVVPLHDVCTNAKHLQPQHPSISQYTTSFIPAGASKFLSGVLGSQTSPRILLAGGQPTLMQSSGAVVLVCSLLLLEPEQAESLASMASWCTVLCKCVLPDMPCKC